MLLRNWLLGLASAFLLFTLPLAARADEPKPSDDAPAAAEEDGGKFTGDPNDAEALLKFAGEAIGKISGEVGENPDAAEKQLDQLEKTFADLKIEKEEALAVRERVDAAIKFFRERIELARTSLDDLKKALETEPTDAAVQKYVSKIAQELNSLTDRDPAAAEKMLNDAKTFLDGIKGKSEDDNVKTAIAQSARAFTSLERQITSARKLAELVGKDAIPLAVEAWVNGEALTDEDLKGKVVLLDFWAVWCGPCVATFPHLREWQEKYGPEGLTIIGLTRYYNFKWDEGAQRAVSAQGEKVSPEDEQAMLKNFAAHHDLKHRFAIQKDASASEFYAVTGIPHVVLIGPDGKVALVRVGAGPANAKDIDDKIKELLEKK